MCGTRPRDCKKRFFKRSDARQTQRRCEEAGAGEAERRADGQAVRTARACCACAEGCRASRCEDCAAATTRGQSRSGACEGGRNACPKGFGACGREADARACCCSPTRGSETSRNTRAEAGDDGRCETNDPAKRAQGSGSVARPESARAA